MKIFLLLATIFTEIVLLFAGCNAPNIGPKMIFYGDSIMYGLNWGPCQPSYATLVSYFEGYYQDNRAVGGTSILSDNQAPKILRDQWGFNDIVFFTPGLNDAILFGDNEAYEKKYKDALTKVLLKLHYSNAKIVYIGTPNHVVNDATSQNRFAQNSTINEYAQINRNAIKALNSSKVKLIDMNQCFVPTYRNTIDGAHPLKLGYEEMFNCYMEYK